MALGDGPAYIAGLIAERLGLRFHPATAVAACGDKFRARGRFQDAGLLVPEFYRLSLDQDSEVAARCAKYPCVLKPLGLSASRGVIRANDPAGFTTAFQRISALLEMPEIRRAHAERDRFVQVESFIPGREFALEGMVTDKVLRVVAIFDKPDPLDGPFFEETIYVTPSRSAGAIQEAIRDTTQRAVQALGLTDGPIHAEMRINDSGVWMLEVAARPIGGLCARVLPGLPELILRYAVNAQDSEPASLSQDAAGVMMIPIPREGIYQQTQGLDKATRIRGIEDVIITAKQGQKLVPLPEGSSYLGFIFARGQNADQAEAALRESHAKLTFEITAPATLNSAMSNARRCWTRIRMRMPR